MSQEARKESEVSEVIPYTHRPISASAPQIALGLPLPLSPPGACSGDNPDPTGNFGQCEEQRLTLAQPASPSPIGEQTPGVLVWVDTSNIRTTLYLATAFGGGVAGDRPSLVACEATEEFAHQVSLSRCPAH